MLSNKNSPSETGPFFYSLCDDSFRERDLIVFALDVDLFTLGQLVELKNIHDFNRPGVLLVDLLKRYESAGRMAGLRVVDWQKIAEYPYSDRVITLRVGSVGHSGIWGTLSPKETDVVATRWIFWDQNGVPRATISMQVDINGSGSSLIQSTTQNQ